MKIDEAKLTAFLLGEISDPDQCRAIEEALASHPELQQQASDTQRLELGLRDAFEKESYVPAKLPLFSMSIPGLEPDDPKSNITKWLPWVSGIAATFVIVSALILLDNRKGLPETATGVNVSRVPPLEARNVEDFDLSLARSQLLGPGATWSDSQVLANSIFYKRATELLIQPLGELPVGSEHRVGHPNLSFLKAWNEPQSSIPLFWDGFGMTRLELALGRGQLPNPEDIKVEALVNAFPYDYEATEESEEPFAVHMEQAESPWKAGQTLLRVGLQGVDTSHEGRLDSNFVFLIDISGSMDEKNKLPLVKEGLKNLVEHMKPQDRVAIVTYGSSSSVFLSSTLGLEREKIVRSINELGPGMGADSRDGISEAYRIASDTFIEAGDNQVIVCTDGDVMLGTNDPIQLSRLVADKARQGISLSAFGFAMTPGRNDRMEALAAQGQGEFGYVDSPMDVVRSFAGRLTGEFVTLASDVKLEVEFNPSKVDTYRLIGYEDTVTEDIDLGTRRPAKLDVLAGHSVTALYEIVPNEIREDPKSNGTEIAALADRPDETIVEELVTVRVHYQPEGRTQEELIEVLFSGEATPFEEASDDMRFAAAVTGFGQLLQDSPYKGDVDFNWVLSTAGSSLGNNSGGYRSQFLEMVRQAEAITNSDYSSAEN